MGFIKVNDLVKDYKINIKKKGILGSLKSLLIPEYRIKQAVKGINFNIEKSEMVGFIGPNGAGKSTTVKMLTGILKATSGKIDIGGLCPFKDRKKNAMRMGVVFGQRSQLWWDLPLFDSFDILKSIYYIPEKKFKKNMELFYDLLGIREFVDQPVRQLSLGQRMRADIAASQLHDPEIIFFDEPTIGLDVVAKEKIREFVRFVNKENKTTMLFTTHDMTDIETTCDRMIIIDNGEIIYDGTVDKIKQMFSTKRVLVAEFKRNYTIANFPKIKIIDEKENKKWIEFNKDDIQVYDLINQLTMEYEMSDFTVQEPGIEQIVREIYKGGITLDKTLYRNN